MTAKQVAFVWQRTASVSSFSNHLFLSCHHTASYRRCLFETNLPLFFVSASVYFYAENNNLQKLCPNVRRTYSLTALVSAQPSVAVDARKYDSLPVIHSAMYCVRLRRA